MAHIRSDSRDDGVRQTRVVHFEGNRIAETWHVENWLDMFKQVGAAERNRIMKLYVMPGACSLASHIALVWAGLPYELVVLSHEEAGGEAFRRINPKAAVPALVLDDGTVITESLAVLQYIAAMAPHTHLGSESGHALAQAQMNELLAYLVSDVHKAWAPVFVPGRYVTRQSDEDDARQAAFGQLAKQYARLNQMMDGRDWALFGHRTVADAYLYVMCSWKDNTPDSLNDYPALAAYTERLGRDPGIRCAQGEESNGDDL
jgi:glutathione S-transferase